MGIARIAVLAGVIAAITGCSGNDTTVNGHSSRSNDSPGGAAIGQFHDSAVTGLGYASRTESGTTDRLGTYRYVAGDVTEFRLGDILLGRSAGTAYPTPADLFLEAPGDLSPAAAVNIARLLQTVDVDADPRNGIAIAPAALAAADGRTINFDVPPDAFADEPQLVAYLAASAARGGPSAADLVAASVADSHLQHELEFILETGAANQRPVPTVTAPPSATTGELVSLAANATDSDGFVTSYSWLQTAGPAVTLTASDSAESQFVAPVVDESTAVEFELRVFDDRDAFDSTTVQVQIDPTSGATNQPPVAADAALVTDEDTTLNGRVTGSDPDADDLAFELVQNAGLGLLHLNPDGRFDYTPAADVNGEDSFTYRAFDGSLRSQPARVTITITPVNDAPHADAGADQSVHGGDIVTLAGAGNDPEGEVSYRWQQTAGSPDIALDGSDQATASFTAPAVTASSTFTFTLTVTDADGATATDSAIVTVTPAGGNLPPVANAGPDQVVDEGADVTLDGTGSLDDDGQLVAYAWNQTAGPSVDLSGADSSMATFTAPAVSSDTALTFELTVTDDDGAHHTDATVVTVTSVRTPPTAAAGPDQTVAETTTVVLDGSASVDGDGAIATYNWAQISGPAVTLTDADTAMASFVAPEVGPLGATLQFRLTVTDDQDLTSTDSTAVFVRDLPLNVFRVGAAKRMVSPSQAHIDGVVEARFGGAPHTQKFNLGGFGIDPLQNFPDPIGALGDQLTDPASETAHVNERGQAEHIWVRVMALSLAGDDRADQTVLFVTLDAIGAGNLIQNGLKAAVVAATGVDPANILFGQTHSHAGPDLQGLWGGVPQDWIENTLYVQAADAARQAMAQREAVTLEVSHDFTSEFNNYRRPRQNTDADADPQVSLLRARSTRTGDVVAQILQYAAHPTSINEDVRAPHPDFVLGALDYLESTGGVALYYNGPIADASPSGSRQGCQSKDGKYGDVRCRGEGIAAAGLGSRKRPSGPLVLEPAMSVRHETVTLPITNPLFVAAGLLGSFNRYYDFAELPADSIPVVGEMVKAQLLTLPQITPTAQTLVSRITLGGEAGLDIVTMPGEATNTFGQYLRGLSPASEVMLFGLTQNSFGYLLPEEEFDYIDTSGDDGFTLPFTGYEEFVSLGPLTVPLLKLEGYHPLFDAGEDANIPTYLTACEDPTSEQCILNIEARRLDYTQRGLVKQCRDFGGPTEFCALLDPDTPLRGICDSLGLQPDTCAAFGSPDGGGLPGVGVPDPGEAPDASLVPLALDSGLRGCDPLDSAHCLYPFPSDHFTVEAAAGSIQSVGRGGTGKRVDFQPLAMPRNTAGRPVDPSEWNRNDGFSPGALIVTYVDGLNLEATYGLPAGQIGFADPSLSLRDDAPIFVLEVDGNDVHRFPVFAEMDVNADMLVPDACRSGGGQLDEKSADEVCTAAGAGTVYRGQPGRSALLIRPARNFNEGKRYIVVLRDLKRADGSVIDAGPVFEACRAETPTGLPPIDERCDTLKTAVLDRVASVVDLDSVYLAWDFTVASTQNQIGRLKHMRDTAFAQLGDDCTQYKPGCAAPQFTVDAITENPKDGIARYVEGTITVPSFVAPVDPSPQERAEVNVLLNTLRNNYPEQFDTLYAQIDQAARDIPYSPGGPGDIGDPHGDGYNTVFDGAGIGLGVSAPPNRLIYNPFDAGGFPSAPNADPSDPQAARYGDGLPDSLSTMTTRFKCEIPAQASPSNPARAGIYGHGLLDSREAVGYDGVPEMGREFNYLFCAVDLFGFATGDIGNVISSLIDLSNFAVIPDASQQGLLNYLFLARALRDPEGFGKDPAFQIDGQPVFDNSDIFYDGNSQGGIVGGAVLAASKDITRGALGSLGMNYSTLLRRSVDFELYSIPLYLSYTDELDRNVLFSMMQMLWDRSENNGYAHHIIDNSAFAGPNNIAKLDPQFGDHQVTMWSADVMARTMGIPADKSMTDRVAANLGQTDREPTVDPYFEFEPLDYGNAEQTAGSALVRWDDVRTGIPNITNFPPNPASRDPHDDSAKKASGRCQKAHFLRRNGQLIDIKGIEFDGELCPAVPALLPDRDGDGVPDADDACPDDPNGSVDSDGDGICNSSDLDDDGDGVDDEADAFPNDPNEWADSDGDGVGDNADQCDDEPASTADGCPAIVDSYDDQLIEAVADATLRGCDFLDPNYCLYPFPSDVFTVDDTTTDTGKRVNLIAAAMPRNVVGKPLDPTEWNRNDGFSPGALIETRVPGLSLDDGIYAEHGLVVPHLTQIQNSLDPASVVVIIDATEFLPGTNVANPLYGKQHLAWAEIDANTTKKAPCNGFEPLQLAGDLGGSQELEDFAAQAREGCQDGLGAANDAARDDPLNDPGPALLIHPGINFEEGHRYIVALRGLRDAAGQPLTPAPGFLVYRDGVASDLPMVEDRREHMNSLFDTLEGSEAGLSRRELYLAWDFTVISERNLTERALHMRDVAFANYLTEVGGTPQYAITSVEDYPLDGDDCLGSAQHPSDPGRGDSNTQNCIARRVTGTITVPSFMDKPRVDDPPSNPLTDQSPVPVAQYVGGRLFYNPADGDDLPDQNPLAPTENFTFTCNIPRSAFDGAPDPAQATSVRQARASLYGHGLLGSQAEGRNQAQLKRFANEHNVMFCMTDWIGMSHYDLANVASILVDMSNFPSLADRAQQGFLNAMFLARLLKDPNGFAADAAFKAGDVSLFDNSNVYYDGNSQGGIMGGALVALSPDIQRGTLGVVGMNYSTLLSRSTDFAPFGALFYNAYPESLDQQFVFSLIQMLWDRAENNGYAQHLGDGRTRLPNVGLPNVPLPGLPEGSYDPAQGPFNPAIARMPEKEILLHPAFGDHQVTYWSAKVMARTIGANGADAYFRRPADQDTANGAVTHTYATRADYLAQRDPDEDDFFALGALDYSDPAAIGGSAIVIWDEGKTAVPPLDNTYPNADNYDPHEYPRRTVAARCQKSRFLRPDGRVVYTDDLNNANTVACPTVDGTGARFAPEPAAIPLGDPPPPAQPDEQHSVLHAACLALSGSVTFCNELSYGTVPTTSQQCLAAGGPDQLCAQFDAVGSAAEAIAAACRDSGGTEPACAIFAGLPARGRIYAGYGEADATWNVGAAAGQYASENTDVVENVEFFTSPEGGEYDPFVHSRAKRRSDGVNSRLSVRAIVVEGSNGKRVALLKSDNYLAQDMLVRRVGQLLAERGSTIRYDDILYSATHNHSSPYQATLSWGVWIFEDVFDQRMFEYQARAMADAIMQAEASLQPARMGATTVRHDTFKGNVMGPQTADDGTPAGYPRDYGDNEITLIRFDNAETGTPIAVWMNHGQHPESLDAYNLITADYLGPLQRMVERRTGAPLVFSQGDVGSAEGPYDRGWVDAEEVDGQPLRRAWAHVGYAQMERGASLLADAVVQGYDEIAALPADYVGDRKVGFTTDFNVGRISAWVPGPVSHPYPSVSNCNTDTTLYGDDPGAPVLGLPDCARYSNPPGFENPLPTIPYSMVTDSLGLHGAPLPDQYDFPAFTAVEENLRLRLQAFKLGEVLLASCACEAQVDLILNLESRLDKPQGNFYDGFDWWCEANRDGEAQNDPLCAEQLKTYPNPRTLEPMTGSLADPVKVAHMRAQIHNDALGWDDPANAASAGHEPDDVEQIKGNFTRLELPADLGYALPVGLGHSGDYNGYTVSYREYMGYDHYRKALTSYGPHTADYMNTRLVRMAAQLNGGEVVGIEPTEPLNLADEQRQRALSSAVGAATGPAFDLWHQTLPLDAGPAEITAQPHDIPRFDGTTVTWVGGNNAVDNPVVAVQREVAPNVWEDFADMSGEVQTQVHYPLGVSGVLATYGGQQQWLWTANFEAFNAWPASIGHTPTGRYRYVIHGHIRQACTNVINCSPEDPLTSAYSLESQPFEVRAEAAFRVTASLAGNQMTLQAQVAYPDTYPSSFRYLNDGACEPSIGKRCSFRPWARVGQLATATVTVRRGASLTRQTLTFSDSSRSVSVANADAAYIAAGAATDAFGNANATCIDLLGTDCTGAPESDTDGDGVVDGADQCPGTPPGTPVDANGCPVEASAESGAPQLGDVCDAYGVSGSEPGCEGLRTLTDVLATACADGTDNGPYCTAAGGNLHALIDTCYANDQSDNPLPLCKLADTVVLGFAAYCRQVANSSAGTVVPEICALLGGQQISDRELAAFRRSGVYRALLLQDELGQSLPLRRASVISTHNSFNATDANTPPTVSGSDPNQLYTIPDQLSMGVRHIELDIHWVPGLEGTAETGGQQATVCHGLGAGEFHAGCTSEHPLTAVLSGLRTWLDANPDTVVVLDIEDVLAPSPLFANVPGADATTAHDTAAHAFNEILGSLIYRPADGGLSCGDGRWIDTTRDDIHRAGKQLIIYSGGCGDGEQFATLVHSKSGVFRQDLFTASGAVNAPDACATNVGFTGDDFRNGLTRVWEDTTLVGASPAGTSGSISIADAAELMRCGLNFPSLDKLTPSDGRLPAMLWSWAEGEPATLAADSCAYLGSDGRIHAGDCAEQRAFACVSNTDPDVWEVAGFGSGHAGATACPTGTRWSVPKSGAFALELAASAGGAEVWLNYAADAGGHWQVGDREPIEVPPPQQLLAGAAKKLLWVPVGVPLGGYARPPVGGDYLPGLQHCEDVLDNPFDDDPAAYFANPALFVEDASKPGMTGMNCAPNMLDALFAEFGDFLPVNQDHDGNPVGTVPDELRAVTSPYATYSPPTRGYYDSFTNKAVAMYDGHDCIVLTKSDMIGMLDELVQAVADYVEAHYDLGALPGCDLHQGLIMSATHTHDGPGALANHSTRYFWLAMDMYQPELFNRLVPQFAQVVMAALDDLQPAQFGYATGTEGYVLPNGQHKNLNSFRRSRSPYTGQRIAQQDALRERIGVLRLDTLSGEPLALVMNYAAHGIAFDVENQFFSGDVLASAERAVEQTFDTPVVAMLVQNTDGDVSPRADGAPTLQRIERFGRLLAPQVRAVYDGIAKFDSQPDLRAVSQRVILSLDRLGYANGEYPYDWGAAQCNGVEGIPEQSPYRCLPSVPPDAQDLADNGVAENGAFVPQDTRVTVAKIGNAVLLAQPGEPLTEYGLRLLEMAQADLGYSPEDVFIWGYSQDHTGYILPDLKTDWLLGGTEGTTTFWGWKLGGRLLDVNRDLLTAIHDGTHPPRDEFQLDYGPYNAIYAQAPSPAPLASANPGAVNSQPQSIQRFETTHFTWLGGDPVVDAPQVRLCRNRSIGCEPVLRSNGEPVEGFGEMHLRYALTPLGHSWTVSLEAPLDMAADDYYFQVQGTAFTGTDNQAYALQSAVFTVTPSTSLVADALNCTGNACEVALSYAPRPDNYRLIDPLVASDKRAPVRAGRVDFKDASGTLIASSHAPDRIEFDGIGNGRAVFHIPATQSDVRIDAYDAWGNSTPGAAPATAAVGGGAIGFLTQASATVGVAVLQATGGDVEGGTDTLTTGLQNAGETLAADIGDSGGDPNAITGVDDPQELVDQAHTAAREIEPVVITGAQLPGWSAPAATGAPAPYPSGADTEQCPDQLGDGCGTFLAIAGGIADPVRNAHNGTFAYPPNWSVGNDPVEGGIPIAEIAAYRFDGASGSFVEIPVQVDERMPYFLANGNSTFSVYSGTDEELTYVWRSDADPAGYWGEEAWGMTRGTCTREYDPAGWDTLAAGETAELDRNRGLASPVPDPIGGLDDDDEVTFMAADAGACPQGLIPEGDAIQSVQTVRLADPLDPSAQRCVYLVRQSNGSTAQARYVDYQRHPNADQWIDRSFFAAGRSDADPLGYNRELLGSSNSGYGPNLTGTVCDNPATPASARPSNQKGVDRDGVDGGDGDRFPRDGVTVTTDTYQWTASGRWMVRDLKVRAPGEDTSAPGYWNRRLDLVDRWKGRAFQQSPDSNVSVVGFEDEQVNWEANSALLGERCGPVRCMREVWGADSGTNVTKTETFYRDAITYRYHVRVHPIPPDGLYTSWDYNRSAMIPASGENVPAGRYYTAFRPQGVLIDGVNDDMGQVDATPPAGTPEAAGEPYQTLYQNLYDGGANLFGPGSPCADNYADCASYYDEFWGYFADYIGGFFAGGGSCFSDDGLIAPVNGSCPTYFDAADPTFNLALAFDNWEQVSGKGDAGSLVYTFEIKGASALATPLVVPYYRDDACLDDGTGDDPVTRPHPGERSTRGDVVAAYRNLNGGTEPDCSLGQTQGAYGAHGIHYFFTGDVDNGFLLGKPINEIDGQQWQFIVPSSRPHNVGVPYANVARVPLQPLISPAVPGL